MTLKDIASKRLFELTDSEYNLLQATIKDLNIDLKNRIGVRLLFDKTIKEAFEEAYNNEK